MATRSLAAVPERGPIRDGIYIRVSAVMGREDERFLSPDLQREAVNRARAAAPGPSVVVGEWADIDVSGASMDRPKLNEALELAAAGGLDRLWVYDLSRWARVTTEGLVELERIEALGCRVMSTAEPVDLTTPEGYFSATMMLAVHKLRRDQIARGWRQVHQHRAEQGLALGSIPPLGYRFSRATGARTLEADPASAPAVVEVFRRYAAGWRLTDVTAALRASLSLSTTNRSAKRILANPVYRGMVRHRGELHRGIHEPLIDAVTWRRVQRRLERDARTPARTLQISHSLVGLVVCAGCQHALYARPDREQRLREPKTTLRLECHTAIARRDCPTAGAGAPAQTDVEAEVLRRVEQRIQRLCIDETARAERAAKRTRAASSGRRLRRELEKVRRARGQLAADRAKREIDDTAYRYGDADLAATEQQLIARIAAIDDTLDAPETAAQLALAEELLRRWPVATTAERNRELRSIVKRVTVRRSQYWREPVAQRLDVEWA